MKCILKTNPATGNMRGATLHTTPIELLTILEALRIYEYERDNPIDKATVRQMLEDLKNREVEADRKTENSSEIPNNCEDEPQTNADQHVQHVGSVESVEPTWTKEEHEAFYTFLWNVINPSEMQDYIEMFEAKDEPQTEEWYTYQDEQEYNDRWQTERSE